MDSTYFGIFGCLGLACFRLLRVYGCSVQGALGEGAVRVAGVDPVLVYMKVYTPHFKDTRGVSLNP